jgi:GNAT superfamily N-acetyltransferase
MEYPDVRRAQPEDREAVAELWTQLLNEQAEQDDRVGIADDALDRWRNDFPVWLDDETARIYVAEGEDGTIEGFVTARRWGPPPIYEESSEVYLDELFVRPEARRMGYGTQLVHAVRYWADQIGARRVRLRVLTANPDGRAFWAAQNAIPMSLTFTIEGEAPDEQSEENEGSKKIGFSSERTGE